MTIRATILDVRLKTPLAVSRALVCLAALAFGGGGAAANAADATAAGVRSFVPADIYSAGPGANGEAPVDSARAAEEFALAKKAVEASRVSDAFRHACLTLAADPSHAEARRLLGQEKVGDSWGGAYAQRMFASGNRWRREFGWVKESDLAKFDEGLRPFGGRWISAAEDARRHDSIERGWAVRTDHFLVLTNIDRAAGVELAERLEAAYQIWRQIFGEFAASPAEMKSRLAGEPRSAAAAKPFRVFYHRNRAEYNAALKSRQPQIEMTLGIYFDADLESHFFAGADQDPGTIVHEAVHQFFYESAKGRTRNLAATANAWAVEGVACYFESLAAVDAEGADDENAAGCWYSLGAPSADRLIAARHRRVVDDYYVPLAELSALGVTDLQDRSDLARLYSQSTGLAAFLIDYQDGKYRDAFRKLLAAIYAGRDKADSLPTLAGRTDAELDGEYLQFMRGLPVMGTLAPSATNP